MSEAKNTQKNDKKNILDTKEPNGSQKTEKIDEASIEHSQSSNKKQSKIWIWAMIGIVVIAVVVFAWLLLNNLNRQNELAIEDNTSEEVAEASPVLLNFSATGLADAPKESVYYEDGQRITKIKLPIYCGLEYQYSVSSDNKVISGYRDTSYSGDAINSLSRYGVTKCRTEAYVKYQIEGDVKMADGTLAVNEKFFEVKPDENRFIVWRFWNHFADKTGVQTGETTGNKIINFVDGENKIVKTFEFELVPIIEDEDFYDKWSDAISSTSKKSGKIETKSLSSLNLNYYKSADDKWHGNGTTKAIDGSLVFTPGQDDSIKKNVLYDADGVKTNQLILTSKCGSNITAGSNGMSICKKDYVAKYGDNVPSGYELGWTYRFGTKTSSNSKATISVDKDNAKREANITVEWQYPSGGQYSGSDNRKTFFFENGSDKIGRTEVVFVPTY